MTLAVVAGGRDLRPTQPRGLPAAGGVSVSTSARLSIITRTFAGDDPFATHCGRQQRVAVVGREVAADRCAMLATRSKGPALPTLLR